MRRVYGGCSGVALNSRKNWYKVVRWSASLGWDNVPQQTFVCPRGIEWKGDLGSSCRNGACGWGKVEEKMCRRFLFPLEIWVNRLIVKVGRSCEV